MTVRRESIAEPVVDVVCLTLTAIVWVGLALDAGGAVRTVASALFVSFVPGWTIVRLAGARVGALVLVTAAALSVSLTVLLGQVLVTRLAWRWDVAAVGLCAGASVGLVLVLMRGLRD